MSNYGPKQYDLYSESDNLNRKATRTGDSVDVGPNSATRAFSTKPGQLSAKEQANAEQKKVRKLSGPVKHFSQDEIEKLNQMYKVG